MYGGEFYSKLTVLDYGHALDTVDDLISALSTEKYILKSIPIFQNYILNSNPNQPVYYKISKIVTGTNKFQVISKLSEIIKLMSNFSNNYILVTSKITFKMLEAHFGLKNKLHVSKDSISQYSMGMALQKRSTLLKPFNIM